MFSCSPADFAFFHFAKSDTDSEDSLHDSDIEAGYEVLEDMLAYTKEPKYIEEEVEAQSEHCDVNADDDIPIWPPVSRDSNTRWCWCSECSSQTQRDS